jgi:hypothetical protein
VEHVRRAALNERSPLLDPEPVLLVHHRDGQVVELHAFLDQRMRADHDPRPFELRLHRAGEERNGHPEVGAQRLDREEVLLGQRLGRRHQRSAEARFHGSEQSVERDDGLAGADVALEQPLHRRFAGKIAVDLRDRLLLVGGQLERQQLPVARDQVAGLAERSRPRLLAVRPGSRKADLEHEQLVEGEPPPRLLPVLERIRTVQRDERVREQRQPFGGLQLRRQRVRHVASVAHRELDEAAQPLRRDLLARGIDGRKVRRRRDAVQVVRADLEAAPLELAAQANPRAGLELLLQPRLVEPDRGDLIALVRDPSLDDRQVSPRPPHRDAANLARDRRLLAGHEVGDPPLGHRRFVAVRPVYEQVADGAQAELGQLLAQRRADAVQRRDRLLERVGPRARAQARPGRGRLLSGKAVRHGSQSRKPGRRTRTSRRFRGLRVCRRPGRAS